MRLNKQQSAHEKVQLLYLAGYYILSCGTDYLAFLKATVQKGNNAVLDDIFIRQCVLFRFVWNLDAIVLANFKQDGVSVCTRIKERVSVFQETFCLFDRKVGEKNVFALLLCTFYSESSERALLSGFWRSRSLCVYA